MLNWKVAVARNDRTERLVLLPIIPSVNHDVRKDSSIGYEVNILLHLYKRVKYSLSAGVC